MRARDDVMLRIVIALRRRVGVTRQDDGNRINFKFAAVNQCLDAYVIYPGMANERCLHYFQHDEEKQKHGEQRPRSFFFPFFLGSCIE